MKIHLEQIKKNNKFHGKNSGFVDKGLVKTCDELVIGGAYLEILTSTEELVHCHCTLPA